MDSSDDVAVAEFTVLHMEELSPSPLNPRVQLDELAQRDLKQNIERYGLLEPLIVRPGKYGGFEVVAGNRRFAALTELYKRDATSGWANVKVQILHRLKNDDAAAFRVAVTENIERESMSPYDETLAILRLFAMELYPDSSNMHRREVASLRPMAKLLKGWAHRVEASRADLAGEYLLSVGQVEAAIDSVFKKRDGLKLMSFVNNRLPLLELPEDVQSALSTGKFPYAAAKEVGKVEDPAKRSELVALALGGMSYRQLIKQAKLVQQPAPEPAADDDTEFIERAKQVSKWLRKKPKLNQNERKQLDAAFRRIEDVFGK